MKKALLISGGVIGAIAILAIGFYVYLSSMGRALDAESKIWIDDIVPQIIATWDAQKLIEHSSPELLQATPQEKLQETFASLSNELGILKEYQGSKGEGGITVWNGKKTVTAQYIAQARFEKGVAQILVQGVKINEEWKIRNFRVNISPSQ